MSCAAASCHSRIWPAVSMVGRADVGRLRSNNEDRVGLEPLAEPWPVAVLADGMGGYNAGEVASTMAVDLVIAAVRRGSDADASLEAAQSELVDALHMANTAIYAAAQSTPEYRGMGTTVVAAMVLSNELLIAHLGDSRAYVWRDGQLQRLTHDHSLVQQNIDAGLLSEEEARFSNYGHLVTRALGVESEVEPELTRWPLQAQDRVLLCSDGLTDMLEDSYLQSLFEENLSSRELLEMLIHAANEAGGNDNIGVILLEKKIEE